MSEPINDAYMQLMEAHEKPEMARLILRLEDQIGAREKRIKELEAACALARTAIEETMWCDPDPYPQHCVWCRVYKHRNDEHKPGCAGWLALKALGGGEEGAKKRR